MPHNVGYCCINVTLAKEGVTTGRTMRKATFEEKGLSYVSELVTKNLNDLITILNWNSDNGIKVFRMSSNIYPWNSEYSLSDLPAYDTHVQLLETAGNIIRQTKQRVTAHPDHYVKLASSQQHVRSNAIHDLNHHNELFTMMGLPANHYHCLNIHVGQNYSVDVVDRFINSFSLLRSDTQRRLVVENDDKANGFSVKQLHDTIYAELYTPITFDYFHHTFHPDGLSSKEAATLAAYTWDTKPLFHYSESKNLHESIDGNPRAHSDYTSEVIDDYGLDIDIDLEVKAKELALFDYNKRRHYDTTNNT